MMQQPGMICPPFGPGRGGLGLGLGRRRLWAAQGMQMMPQQAAPMQYSPFQAQPMQWAMPWQGIGVGGQGTPLGSYLLLGAVVVAGLYLLNKSQSHNQDIKTVKSTTKTARPD